MNPFRYPLIEVHPTHAVVVAEHLTLADAEHAAAWLAHTPYARRRGRPK